MSNQTIQANTLSEENDSPPQTKISASDVIRNPGLSVASNSFTGQTTIDMLMDVNLHVSVELGRTSLSVRQVLDLQKGSVVELDRMAGDPVDIYVNDHLIAQGEVVVVDDKFGVRISQLISPNPKNAGSNGE